jgi:hypothetical protein
MGELDNNVFINKWHCTVDDYYLHKTYDIYYIDGSHRRAVFTSFSTEEEIAPQLLYLIDKDLKEKGWVKNEPEVKESKYNPANDPYYEQESLYVDNEINCGS